MSTGLSKQQAIGWLPWEEQFERSDETAKLQVAGKEMGDEEFEAARKRIFF